MRGQPKFLDPNLATLPILGHNRDSEMPHSTSPPTIPG